MSEVGAGVQGNGSSLTVSTASSASMDIRALPTHQGRAPALSWGPIYAIRVSTVWLTPIDGPPCSGFTSLSIRLDPPGALSLDSDRAHEGDGALTRHHRLVCAWRRERRTRVDLRVRVQRFVLSTRPRAAPRLDDDLLRLAQLTRNLFLPPPFS